MEHHPDRQRRQLLGAAAALAAGAVLPPSALANVIDAPAHRKSDVGEHYRPPVSFGLGGVPLGNEFAYLTEDDAGKILESAWKVGVRYFDVSPWYGLGLAERRLGRLLADKNREDYVVSSKVGKLLKPVRGAKGSKYFPYSSSPNEVVFDYTAGGTRRSIEDSLQRLGIDSLDIVFVHDLSPDNKFLPTPWQDQFRIAQTGAFVELSRMREEGLIKGWGLGVNTPQPILQLLQVADPDLCLLASQYSLIEHKAALEQVFPAARQKKVSFVMGSSLNAGFISGSPRYNYGDESYRIPHDHIVKREQLRAVAAEYGVDLRTAALQFSAAPDVAAALIVGASSDAQVLADATAMKARIPAGFWAELKHKGLIEAEAAVPTLV